VASNMGHQGGKIADKKERSEYFKWLYNFEYNIFGILKPSMNIILKTSSGYSLKMSNNIIDETKKKRRESYLSDDKNQDIHEKDQSHQSKTLESYLQAAEEYPQDFKIIECIENNNLLSPEIIHNKIWEILKYETVS
jgi:dTMP kinase